MQKRRETEKEERMLEANAKLMEHLTNPKPNYAGRSNNPSRASEPTERTEQDEIENKENGTKKKHFEINLDPAYWKPRFLFPYALDPAPLRLKKGKQKPEEIIAEKKRQRLLGDQSILSTNKYEFPLNMI